VLRPSTIESSRAAIFFRDNAGDFLPGGERIIEIPEEQEAEEDVASPGLIVFARGN
jgi:hypothetical protein